MGKQTVASCQRMGFYHLKNFTANLAFVCCQHHGSPADSNNNLTWYNPFKTNILATLLQFRRGVPKKAYEISKSEYFTRFQDFWKDFKISRKISRLQEGFVDFRWDFKISSEILSKILRFHVGFQDFKISLSHTSKYMLVHAVTVIALLHVNTMQWDCIIGHNIISTCS